MAFSSGPRFEDDEDNLIRRGLLRPNQIQIPRNPNRAIGDVAGSLVIHLKRQALNGDTQSE